MKITKDHLQNKIIYTYQLTLANIMDDKAYIRSTQFAYNQGRISVLTELLQLIDPEEDGE